MKQNSDLYRQNLDKYCSYGYNYTISLVLRVLSTRLVNFQSQPTAEHGLMQTQMD